MEMMGSSWGLLQGVAGVEKVNEPSHQFAFWEMCSSRLAYAHSDSHFVGRPKSIC